MSTSGSAARLRLLLDVDGVLANFVESYLDLVAIVTGRRYQPEQVTQFDIGGSLGLTPAESSEVKRLLGESQGFCLALRMYEGAQDGVARLQQLADVYIVTSPWNSCPTWTHEREAWLKKHFKIPHSRITHTSAKYLCRGDVFVDDKVDAVIKWQSEHPTALGVVWDTPHNQLDSYDGVRTSDWGMLARLIRERCVTRGLVELERATR